MKRHYLLAGAALALACLLPGQAPPPTYIPQTRFARGQNVVPSYEGWIKNSDGTFTLVFGYMNRNYEEELVIPVGADNKLEPGPADQGQPAYFLPRRQAWAFRVKVPSDFGNKELVWTLNAYGKPEKAYGSLKSDEEITERIIMTRGNLSPGLDDPNHPPTLSIAAPGRATAGQPVALTANVSDDGLPKPRVPRAAAAADGKSQTNSASRIRIGLAVRWMQYRGPAKVAFAEAGPITEGKVLQRAVFPEPGTYVLRAVATVGALSVSSDVEIVVAKP